MSKIGWGVYGILSILFFVYLALPNPEFPSQLPDSYQSGEPADVETPLRRGYYSDLNRAEVLSHYSREFTLSFGPIRIPVYRLNYPPEESQTIIRDQTRSTYLEEIVHPFRESIFVSGFEPKADKDVLIVNGKNYNQKVIVRYYSTTLQKRLLTGLLIVSVIPFLLYSLFGTFKKLLPLLGRLIK